MNKDNVVVNKNKLFTFCLLFDYIYVIVYNKFVMQKYFGGIHND